MKNYLEVVIERLEALKNEQGQASPAQIMGVVVKSAVDHKLTFDVKKDMLQAILSVDGITPDEAELLRDLEATRNT